ncbi:unnamed protein product [Brachionus calyciflorus]|uniref:guanylate cyclase n=1 Tax=Brachionus calyciflorus TaxID=104777 RepID=A0A813NPS8_9BILA|nr:unnamed protein product [Brachionus calyciflorus]
MTRYFNSHFLLKIIKLVFFFLCKAKVKCLQKQLGFLYFKNVFTEYRKQLESIANSLQSFYFNLNTFNDLLLNHNEFGQIFSQKTIPHFNCLIDHNQQGEKNLKIFFAPFTLNSFSNNFYYGLIKASSFYLFKTKIKLEKLNNFKNNFGYLIKSDDNLTKIFSDFDDSSNEPEDLCLSDDIFKSTYPFTIFLSRDMSIIQLGDGLAKQLSNMITENLNFETYFQIIRPKMECINFDVLLMNQSTSFLIRIRNSQMDLKGSITYLDETDSLMFICSPVIASLEELTGRGLFISDIPIHDATRDIILVGEQTKAQEGLKFRMEKLKKSIVQAQLDTEENKQKNIELLNMIFPSDIAKMLWRGEKVEARVVKNVTLLYSDIVGFTNICSSAQPIEIIEMLKRLYTDFDNVIGLLDVYKIETIGDAYIVAGGLHRPSKYHAQQIAWMSLLMMYYASKNYTPKHNEIKIRIGIHSGDVMAGIVGVKQPRYCLFGNNCTITNKLESQSEEKRIHVSPKSKDLIDEINGFEFESRGREYLQDDRETWFLNSYKNSKLSNEHNLVLHIKEALKECRI